VSQAADGRFMQNEVERETGVAFPFGLHDFDRLRRGSGPIWNPLFHFDEDDMFLAATSQK